MKLVLKKVVRDSWGKKLIYYSITNNDYKDPKATVTLYPNWLKKAGVKKEDYPEKLEIEILGY